MCLWKHPTPANVFMETDGIMNQPLQIPAHHSQLQQRLLSGQLESHVPPSAVSKQGWHVLLTSRNSNSSLMVKINREAICRINPFTDPGREGAAEAKARGAASQHTYESHAPFPLPFDLLPLFFIPTEGVQPQGLWWSKQRNCLKNPASIYFCFHLFLSDLVGQRLIPIRQKISACCGTQGRGGGCRARAAQTFPPSWAPTASIPNQTLRHPKSVPPASHTDHSSIPC